MRTGSGNFTKRIELYKPTDPTKGLVSEEDLKYVRKIWCSLRQITARDQLKDSIAIQDQLFTIRFRYIQGLDNSCRFKFNNAWYSIKTIEINDRDHEITCSCGFDSRLNENSSITT